jgi:hypothetical protein
MTVKDSGIPKVRLMGSESLMVKYLERQTVIPKEKRMERSRD